MNLSIHFTRFLNISLNKYCTLYSCQRLVVGKFRMPNDQLTAESRHGHHLLSASNQRGILLKSRRPNTVQKQHSDFWLAVLHFFTEIMFTLKLAWLTYDKCSKVTISRTVSLQQVELSWQRLEIVLHLPSALPPRVRWRHHNPCKWINQSLAPVMHFKQNTLQGLQGA